MNKCLFTGNLVADPELKTLNNGTSVVNFTVAVNRTYNKGEEKVNEVVFLECEAFAKGGETIHKYFSKGEPITFEASAKQDTWLDKTTGQKRSKIKFRVTEFWFVTKYPYKNSGLPKTVEEPAEGGEVSSDIPF